MKLVLYVAATSWLLFGISHFASAQQGTTEIIAQDGLLLPGQTQPIDNVGPWPAINEGGKVLFSFETPGSNGLLLAEWDRGLYDVLLDEGELGVPGSAFPAGYADDNVFVWVQDLPDLYTFVFDPGTHLWKEYYIQGTPDPAGNGELLHSWVPHTSPNGHWISFQKLFNTQNGVFDNGRLTVVDGVGPENRIVREGEAAPGGGDFYLFSMRSPISGEGLPDDYTINRHGQAAFFGELEPSALEAGWFFWNGNTIQEIVRHGDLTPDGDTFVSPHSGMSSSIKATRAEINDLGHAAISSVISRAQGGSHYAIFLWDGSGLQERFRFPITVGSISMDSLVSSVRFNNAGHMAFSATSFSQFTSTLSRALILLRDNETRILFEYNEVIEDDLQFKYLENYGENYNYREPLFLMNQYGVVCAEATLQANGGFERNGIFLSDGIDRIKVVLELADDGGGQTPGDPHLSYFSLQGCRYLNDFGQVTYFVQTLENGVRSVRLFTPNLEWRSPNSGNWDDKDNWTLGLPPARVHQVSIKPFVPATVAGPSADTTVNELCIGGDPAVRVELQLQENVTLTANDGVSVLEGGVFAGTGTVAGDVDVSGEVSPGMSPGEITITGDLMLTSDAVTSVEVEGTQPNRYDRLIVQGDVQLDGGLDVSFTGRAFLAAGQEFLIGDFAETVSGQFANAPQGTVVHSSGNLQVAVSYTLGDGNDFGLVVTSVEAIQPFGRKLLDGVEIAGNLADTDDSDDVYYELDPSPTTNPTKQIVDLILLAETTVTNPASFSFRLEAAMSGGPEGDVIQSIELWNETDQVWEVLDTRPATTADSTIHVSPTGDLTRFIHPLTDEIIAKVKWFSPEFSDTPFDWSIDIDQLGWLIL